jgi:SAM-dependent methyltransferase
VELIPKDLRRYPHIKEHNWVIHKILINFIAECSRKFARGTLVDIGCGMKPYKDLFDPYVDSYIGIDPNACQNDHSCPGVSADAYNTTLNDGTCEIILCTEVLEHLEDPGRALSEMNRILKDDGIVILTVPFFWHIHEAPRDFYRYSEYGLRHLFEEAGFGIIEIRPLTGFCVTFIQLLVYFLMRFQKGIVLKTAGRTLNWGLQYLALWLNRHDRSTEFTNLYGLVARKKSIQ